MAIEGLLIHDINRVLNDNELSGIIPKALSSLLNLKGLYFSFHFQLLLLQKNSQLGKGRCKTTNWKGQSLIFWETCALGIFVSFSILELKNY